MPSALIHILRRLGRVLGSSCRSKTHPVSTHPCPTSAPPSTREPPPLLLQLSLWLAMCPLCAVQIPSFCDFGALHCIITCYGWLAVSCVPGDCGGGTVLCYPTNSAFHLAIRSRRCNQGLHFLGGLAWRRLSVFEGLF